MRRIVRLAVVLMIVSSVGAAGAAAAGCRVSFSHGFKFVSYHGGFFGSGDFRPGKGCGDKNHTHYRENECKKPPKDSNHFEHNFIKGGNKSEHSHDGQGGNSFGRYGNRNL